MNKLKTDYSCDLNLWLMYFFYHHLPIYAKKKFSKKG